VVTGDDDGRLLAWQNPTTPFGESWAPLLVDDDGDYVHGLALADLDGDGDMDVVAGGEDREIIACENRLDSTLRLNGGRFRLEVEWEDFRGRTGVGTPVLVTRDTGYFWFFNDSNVELIVKVLDGRAINNHFWVFYGALSNVAYTMTVTDTVTGASKTYSNPLSQFASVGDTRALPGAVSSAVSAVFGDETLIVDSQAFGPFDGEAGAVPDLPLATSAPGSFTSLASTTTGCNASDTSLCLNDDRFELAVEWRDFKGRTGSGHAMSLTGDTGYFWFFNDSNVELVVKVLDGRTNNGCFWTFFGALSNVEYTLTVTDTDTGLQKTYFNPLEQFASRGDTRSFCE
jgi:hypothetical protein